MKYTLYKLTAAIVGATLLGGVTIPAFAETGLLGASITATASATVTTGGMGTGISAGASAKANLRAAALAKLVSNAQTRADQEITRRIDALNALNTRVNAMVKISASDKGLLSSSIATQITAMTALQAQIATDAAANSTSSLKTDIQSITKSYRIFMLIIPQGAIEAASDRVLDIAGMFTTLSGQLQTRITAAQTAGNPMTTSVAAMADMNAKIADANTQANAAATEIASLQPDNGDATIQASNTGSRLASGALTLPGVMNTPMVTGISLRAIRLSNTTGALF